VLRKGVRSFVSEEPPAKLQILTLATKLLVLCPGAPKLNALSQYLFTLARYDQDYDVRDRARFLHALLRGVREEKTLGEDPVEDDSEDAGGVTLRREQVKVVLLGRRDAVSKPALEREFCSFSLANCRRKRP
jgi:AP-3 complex subunit beta